MRWCCRCNGVENADRLRALLPQEVVAAAVYVGTEMAGPGHVKHHGRGGLISRSCPDGAADVGDEGGQAIGPAAIGQDSRNLCLSEPASEGGANQSCANDSDGHDLSPFVSALETAA
jgi:ketopantoate reductase